MMTDAYISIAILIIAFILFLTEVFPLAITALLVPISLVLTGVLSAKQAFADFANKWTLIFMFMFMVGEALFRTGFAQKAGEWAVKAAKGSEVRLMLNIMIITAFLSAFLSNTGTTVCLLPIVLAIVRVGGYSPRSFLMALAYAASFGGTLSLIGTPPNGVVNALLDKAGLQPFGFFEFGKVGIIITIIGIAYMALLGRKFLPKGQLTGEAEEAAGERASFKPRLEKMPLAVAIFFFVVAIMVLSGTPATKHFFRKVLHLDLLVAAALGAFLVVATRCITWKEAWQAVDWTTVFLFACMFPLSTALKVTGGVKLIAHAVTSIVHTPFGLLAAMAFVTAFLTQFASNTATTMIVAPIALAAAQGMGVNPYPVIMAVAISASCCFMTPIATPPNTIVLGPGQLRFIDYIKAGWLIQLISYIVCITFVPMLWKF